MEGALVKVRLASLPWPIRTLSTPDQLLLVQCWWLGLTAALACRGTLQVWLRLADVFARGLQVIAAPVTL